EPGLVDRRRLLDQRQRLGEAMRAQLEIGELGQAARRVEPVGAVVLAVLRQRFAQDVPRLGETFLARQHRAQYPQWLGRAAMRVAPRDRDRAFGRSAGL